MVFPGNCPARLARKPGQIAQWLHKGTRAGKKSTPCGWKRRAAHLLLPVLLSVFSWGRCEAKSLPPCFPPVEIAHAKIVRVERNGVLVLKDGRAATLEGILLPGGAADDAPNLYAIRAIARLAKLASGRTVTIASEPPKEDRYGRLRAEVLALSAGGENWLQRTLIAEGLARVDIAPDRNECAAELYAVEARAREARSGLWAEPAYAVRTPSHAGNGAGTFQIVEGTVKRATGGGGRIFLQFGPDRSRDFSVVISADDLRTFRAIGVDPYSYEGQTIRARGWIETARRPEMDIATPANIEIVRSPVLRGSLAAPR